MLEMKNTLEKLEKEGSPILVSVVGIGKMGRSLVDRLLTLKGMRCSLVVNRHIEKAHKALIYLGIKEEDIISVKTVEEVEEAIKSEKFAITDDYNLAVTSPSIQVVVEATGNPQYGAKVAYNSIINKKHIIMLNVECDSVIGPTLYKLAKENGVVYSGAAGDEPAAIMELVEFAWGLGFEVVAVGKGKNNPKDIHATNESVAVLSVLKDVCAKSLTSFVDATNTMIELNAVGNATGFKPDIDGCHGVKSDIKELGKKLSLVEEGGILNNYNVLEYVQGIAPGVFAIVRGNSKETIDTLRYVGMGNGPNYVLYRPFHLCSLETPISIFKAAIKNESTIAPIQGQICDTITYAKRDMKKGDKIQGIGSDFVYGQLVTHEKCVSENLLPIALITSETRLKVDVKKDELITYDMVELEEEELITTLRRKQDMENVQK